MESPESLALMAGKMMTLGINQDGSNAPDDLQGVVTLVYQTLQRYQSHQYSDRDIISRILNDPIGQAVCAMGGSQSIG